MFDRKERSRNHHTQYLIQSLSHPATIKGMASPRIPACFLAQQFTRHLLRGHVPLRYFRVCLFHQQNYLKTSNDATCKHVSTVPQHVMADTVMRTRYSQLVRTLTISTDSSKTTIGEKKWKILERKLNLSNCALKISFVHHSNNAEESAVLSFKNPVFRDYVLDIQKQYNEARDKITLGDTTEKERKQLSATISNLSSVASKIEEWRKLEEDIKSVRQLSSDGTDKELQELAGEELEEYEEKLETVQNEVIDLLSPVEVTDDSDAIIEFTAGVGGQEAMLFTADIFNMYQKFAAHMKWTFEILEFDSSDLGGLRHATVSISGFQAYKRFKFEAGVHRVQRIPKTERQGRVHTSTMAVAVLPQPKQIDIKLENKDLKIETKRASGAGGQHVNTTDSAVRILHIPTGIVAESQQERSQIKNRQIAMKLLQAKIYSQRLEQQMKTEQNLRKEQVGSSARSEKIRTYNFAQDRITDHRLGVSLHGMDDFLSGGELLNSMMDRLIDQSKEEELTYLVEEFVRTRQTEGV